MQDKTNVSGNRCIFPKTGSDLWLNRPMIKNQMDKRRKKLNISLD
jgi:hypothetical protein